MSTNDDELLNTNDDELFVLSPSISNDENDNLNVAELAVIAHDIDDLLLIEEKLHPDVNLVQDNDSYHFEVRAVFFNITN